MPVTLCAHLLALAERIEIDDFVGAVLVFLLDAAHEHHGVMVRRLVSEIEAAEGEVRASVGEVLHVGRDEAENPEVPVGHAREIDGLQDEMPELHDLRRLDRRAPCG